MVEGELHRLLLDKTLTVEGAAADAGAVGEEIGRILEMLADKMQLAPEFANDISECTDTSKLYVLPNGYIYSYSKVSGLLCDNLLFKGTNDNGVLYEGKGYKTNSVFSSSFGEQTAGSSLIQANSIMTGFIPYNKEIIRVCGYMNSDLHSSDYMVFYNSNFELISDQRGRCAFYVDSYAQTFEDETAFAGVKRFTFDLDTMISKSSYYGNIIKNEAKYVRFSLYDPDITKTVITLGEDIVVGTENRWINTGREFVSSDCEDRIIPLEKTAEDHESRIKTLELYGADSVSGEEIPAYIKTEADAVLARLLKVQGNRSFNMIALSDFHYGGQGDNKDNLIRASKAISYMQNRIHIDAIVTLGDDLPYGATYDDNMRATADRWLKEINEILSITQRTGVLDFRTPGNHDRFGTTEQYMPDNAIYSLISGYNRKCDYVNAPIGYAYYDFDSYKLRVIVLNTAETEGKGRFSENSGYHVGNKQYEWIIKILNMSDKEDANEWQILTLSHHRPDDWQKNTDNPSKYTVEYILPNILNAYKTGSSYSADISSENISVKCNFEGKNQARLIGSIHGHHHNYKYSCMRLGDANSGLSDIMAVGTPTTSFGVDKNADNDGNTYTSVKGTAQETAFCLYSIDLDDHIIHAIHYGAGCDREVNY